MPAVEFSVVSGYRRRWREEMGSRLKGFAVLILVVLAGCDQAAVMKKITPPEDEATARSYVELLHQDKFDQIEKDLDPSIQGPGTLATLASMTRMLPAGAPSSIKVVGYQTSLTPDSRTTRVTREYEFPGRWLLAEIVMRKSGEAVTVLGFHLTPMTDSLEHVNRFTLAGKAASQYTILGMAVLAPLFSLYALVLCIRTKLGKTKWLWLVLLLLGIGKVAVNWTTGQIFLTPIAFQIPPGGANSLLYSPWQVYVSLPVGAIVFLVLRRKLAAPTPHEEARSATVTV
jgi:hypothetical protein